MKTLIRLTPPVLFAVGLLIALLQRFQTSLQWQNVEPLLGISLIPLPIIVLVNFFAARLILDLFHRPSGILLFGFLCLLALATGPCIVFMTDF